MSKSGENGSPPMCTDVFKPTLVLVVFFKKINHKKMSLGYGNNCIRDGKLWCKFTFSRMDLSFDPIID